MKNFYGMLGQMVRQGDRMTKLSFGFAALLCVSFPALAEIDLSGCVGCD